MEQDLILLKQKQAKRKRRIGISFIIFGGFITCSMLVLTVWPGALISLLFPDMNWIGGDGAASFLVNGILAVAYFALIVGLIFLAGAVPLIALPIAVVIGIPSLVGGIALLRNKKWGLRLLVFESVLYLVIFPLGTLLAIFTFRLNHRERKIRTL